jgi:site-specific recombinase XerC
MFPPPASHHADALWLSRNGFALDRDDISKRIKERLGRRTGKRFTAHMFRHASASYIVDAAPAQARMVVGVLGHSGFRTAQEHYIKGQQHTAVRDYQRAVTDLLKRSSSSSRGRSGRPE